MIHQHIRHQKYMPQAVELTEKEDDGASEKAQRLYLEIRRSNKHLITKDMAFGRHDSSYQDAGTILPTTGPSYRGTNPSGWRTTPICPARKGERPDIRHFLGRDK